jgi:ABC-type sugar transport system ATPase subunit
VVSHIEHLGSRNIVNVELGGRLLKVTVQPDQKYAENDIVWLGFAPQPEHVMDPKTHRFFR